MNLSSVRPILYVIVAFLLSTRLSSAEDWPQFRGPDGQGHSDARNVPITWDPETNVAWKVPIPGAGWSSPVVAKGRIYLTTAVVDGTEEVTALGKYNKKISSPYSLRTLCIDDESGDVLWNVETHQVPAETSIHPKNSHASSTPIVTNDRVYVHFGTYGTAALDLDGNVIWTKQIDYHPVHGSGSSLIVFEDLLVFNCDGGDKAHVIALDAATGDERWKTARPEGPKKKFSFSTPLIIDVNGTPQLISAGSGSVVAYDPHSCRQLWMARYPNRFSVVPRPVFAGGLVLVCTGYEGPPELLAIRPDGTGDVTESHIAWREKKFVPHNPSPIVHENRVFLMSDNGIASCRDLDTGDLIWKERVGGDHSASPIFADGRIYILSENGICTVISAADEYEELAKNDLQEATLASITPLDRALLIRTESSLYRIGN